MDADTSARLCEVRASRSLCLRKLSEFYFRPEDDGYCHALRVELRTLEVEELRLMQTNFIERSGHYWAVA